MSAVDRFCERFRLRWLVLFCVVLKLIDMFCLLFSRDGTICDQICRAWGSRIFATYSRNRNSCTVRSFSFLISGFCVYVLFTWCKRLIIVEACYFDWEALLLHWNWGRECEGRVFFWLVSVVVVYYFTESLSGLVCNKC